MNGEPSLSVIVPVLNGEELLGASLSALGSSDIPRGEWELIVVDDGSDDRSGEVARSLGADHVIRLGDVPAGPARARNRGAEVARAPILVFIDSDVIVHQDTLRRFRELFEGDSTLGAAFGAYDDAPSDPSFLSQYRNLFHRYNHLLGAGEASTFWAGCGAVRRDVFEEMGGYDVHMFRRPQIEDIELGVRIREAGHRIVLRPEIQGCHLKRWTLAGIVRTDLFDRGIPWVRLMLRRDSTQEDLNLRRVEKVKTGVLGLSLVALAAGAAFWDIRWVFLASLLLGLLLVLNLPTYRWFAGLRGWGFALRVVPLNVMYYLLCGLAVPGGWLLHTRDRILRHRGKRS